MEPRFRFVMAVKSVVLLMLMASVDKTESACTLPSALSGTWHSSQWGDLVFSSGNLMDVTGLTDIGNVQFQCEVASGNTYVLRSVNTVSVLGNVVYVVTCLEMTQLSSYKYAYYHSTSDTQFSTAKEPVMLVSPANTITITTACDATSHSTGTNHMMIASGHETDAATQCPNPLLATFNNYTIDKGSGQQCGGVGYINVCNDRQSVTADYSVCSQKVFYSNDGDLQCVYHSSSGGTYYVNLYNFDTTVDDTNTFRFSCVAIAYGSDEYVYATQFPRACDSSQTSTSVPSTPHQGGTFELVANVTCLPSSSSSGSNIAIIIVIIILLLLIIALVALAVYHFKYKKRWPAFKRKITCQKSKSSSLTKIDPVTAEASKEEIEMKRTTKEEAPPVNRPVTQDPVNPMKLAENPPAEPARDTAVDYEVAAITTATTSHEVIGESGEPLSVSQPRRLPPLETHAVPEVPGTPTKEMM